LPASQQLATGLHAQVHARQCLGIAVVQRARETLEAGFQEQSLPAERAHEVAGDGEVDAAGDVEAEPFGARDEDQREVERDAGDGHGDGAADAAQGGRQDGEGEEDVERAVRALGDERDGGPEQDIERHREPRDAGEGHARSGHQGEDRHAVDEVEHQHRERVRIENEDATGEREEQGRLRGIKVDRKRGGHRHDHATLRDVALDPHEVGVSHAALLYPECAALHTQHQRGSAERTACSTGPGRSSVSDSAARSMTSAV
jgi:hypothetical protein